MSLRSALRGWPPALVPLTLLLLVLVSADWSAGQVPVKKPIPEEVEGPKARPRRGQPLRIEDEEPGARRTPTGVGAPAAVDLAAEAARARHPFVRDLFKGLAVPHDRLRFVSPPREDVIEPLPKFLTLKPGRSVFVKARRLGDVAEYSVSLTSDHAIIYYEQHAIDRVEEFLKRKLELEPPGSKAYLAREDMLREAERALTAVVRFHESARERGVREGTGWDELDARLRGALRSVQLRQLRLLEERGQWEDAVALGAHLARTYPDAKDVQKEFAGLLGRQAAQSLKERDYRRARAQLERLLERFPTDPAVGRLRDQLQRRAGELLAEAQKLLDEDKKQEAARRVQEAEAVWPYSNELRSYRVRLDSAYSILYVGVRALPQLLSPATACTDVERQALDLLFEGLVKYRAHAPGGPRYEPALAADLPRLSPLGRSFQLRRPAYWSDGQRVSAPDVRYTLGLLRDSGWPGHTPAWAELFDRRNPVSLSGDAFQVKLTLGQGYLDPLSLMNFKVLPQHSRLKKADDITFARRPVGSGPFRYDGVAENQAVFVANSFYGARPDKTGLPRLGEIRFYQPTEPAADFRNSRLHVLLDPPTKLVRQLQEENTGAVKYETLRNRRVWFLAVNHRQSALADVNLRRALAHAINREQILNDCFRAGLADVHRPLNGPYPPDSWAYDPKAAPADPYLLTLARPLAKEVLKGRRDGLKLRLLYPSGDEAVELACKLIKKQVQDLDVGLDLELTARAPADLRRDVEVDHQYDLAYYSWDYPDHTYWLWPLFDPRGGRNFLGYRDDAELEALFRQLLSHREFARVRALTHQVHAHLVAHMPLIPLWQLDTHLVLHPRLELPGPLDAQALFSDVDLWELKVR